MRYGIRFGEYFTYAAEELPSLLSITSADFKWIITALLLSVATKLIRKKLEKIEPKDVIKWLVKKWPFSDPGLPYVLWENKSHIKSKKKE